MPFLEEEDRKNITDLNYAKVVQAVACYKKWDGIPVNAFGGLVPSKENRNSLGILFPSTLFDGRAPEGGAILSVFMGGMKKPEVIDKTDEELQKMVLSEISEAMKTSSKPDLLKIFRYRSAIPQYELSSGERFKTIENLQKRYQGLILAGNIRDGIGMADRVKQGKNIAQDIISNRL